MNCAQKKLSANVAVPPASAGFLAKGHLPWVSRQWRLLANDKGDNEIISGAVYSQGYFI